jgi:hypothetical protein
VRDTVVENPAAYRNFDDTVVTEVLGAGLTSLGSGQREVAQLRGAPATAGTVLTRSAGADDHRNSYITGFSRIASSMIRRLSSTNLRHAWYQRDSSVSRQLPPQTIIFWWWYRTVRPALKFLTCGPIIKTLGISDTSAGSRLAGYNLVSFP